MNTSSSRLPGLDGIRAVAILLVLVSHTWPNYWLQPYGALGVDLFFVLSGFLITGLVVTTSPGLFYWRRAFRILPPVLAYLFALAVLAKLSVLRVEPHGWLAGLLFVRDYYPHRDWLTGHLWSLSIEEKFYLTYPWIVWALGRKLGRKWAFRATLVLLAVGPLVRLVTPSAQGTLHGRCDLLLFGCAAALYDGELRVSRTLQLLLAAIALTLPLAMRYALAHFLDGTLRGMLFAVLVWNAARGTRTWLDWKPLVWIGQLSYSLYLWQQLFLGPDHGLPWFAALSLAFIVAVAAQQLVEKPALQLREQLPLFWPSLSYGISRRARACRRLPLLRALSYRGGTASR